MPQSTSLNSHSLRVAIIGGGPAGLMAAEVIASAGFKVSLYDAMPSVGRKFLLAGVGGMNITHSESHEKLLARYANATPFLTSYLNEFSSEQLRDWIHGLGVETFVGSSGRVFPRDMKAAPLLRAWLHRLRELGVEFYPRHRWNGWEDDGSLRIIDQQNNEHVEKNIAADAVVLALGGASWQRLGSDGAWVNLLREEDIAIADLLPSNCGFETPWSEKFKQEFSGAPLQTINLTAVDQKGVAHTIRGEAMIANTGIEGTSVYALSAMLRDSIIATGNAELTIDLLPDLSAEKIQSLLNKPRGKNSASNFLRKQLNLPSIKLSLLRELTPVTIWQDNSKLAQAIKNLRLQLNDYRPIDEAISTAGGIQSTELNNQLMLEKLRGVFCAGEMLDWEAPTGGYLLTACFATGRAAGFGVVDYLRQTQS
ncbi:MAG: TIGR03862 family flavoprotein [Gammaproteobacteria bacterium]|nr:MAG: TIGR03862 family flavoprotein [Gammaproteobacteria bacterium]